MSSPSKSLMSEVTYEGVKVKVCDVLVAINALPMNALLTTSEAAIFLRQSVRTLERWRKDGSGPTYSQGGGASAKGPNQSCLYEKSDLAAWVQASKVTSSMQAAIRKGQAFATIFDIAEPCAFYCDERGDVESMVEENLLGTVVERVGRWDIAWLTPVEAASRRWSDLGSHQAFAASVSSVLSHVHRGIEAAVDATDIASVSKEAHSGGKAGSA